LRNFELVALTCNANHEDDHGHDRNRREKGASNVATGAVEDAL
jgi:hypothetical protein